MFFGIQGLDMKACGYDGPTALSQRFQFPSLLAAANCSKIAVHCGKCSPQINHCGRIGLFPSLLPVPQPVSEIQQTSASPSVVTLAWPSVQPPAGNILDYEVKYYEKVSRSGRRRPLVFLAQPFGSPLAASEAGLLYAGRLDIWHAGVSVDDSSLGLEK